MSIDKLVAGDVLSGFVIDGVEATPYVVGTLTRDDEGVEVMVPYVPGLPSGQFEVARKWFEDEALQSNFLFETKDGAVSLFECRISSRTMGGTSLGQFRPTEIVLSRRTGDLGDELRLREVQSTLDGLAEWTRLRAAHQKADVDDQSLVKKVTVEVETREEITWTQGDVTMCLRTHWAGDNSKPGVHIDEWVVLSSRFEDSRPFHEHLRHQQKVRSLVSLMLGAAVNFRKHEIRDIRFAREMPDGSLVELFRELISRRTVGQYSQPFADLSRSRLETVAHLPQISTASLTKWATMYDDWSRVIDPTVGLLSRPGAFAEDIVISTNLALEAAGQLLPKGAGEHALFGTRKTTSRHVFRCLTSLNVDWSLAADSVYGLAEAIANNYNTIKHYDRGHMPDRYETYWVGQVSLLVVRMLVVNLLDDTGEIVRSLGTGWRLPNLLRNLGDNNLHIDNVGKFVPIAGN
jgi:hypothetical protein